MGLLGDVVNCVPIVGHIKGMVHYACGDTERGDAAVRSATRTAVVLGAGVAGALACPAGAVAAATAAGAAADLAFYANEEEQLQGIARVIKTPGKVQSWLAAGINVLGDGCLGVSLGVSAGLGVIGLNGSVLEEQLPRRWRQFLQENETLFFFSEMIIERDEYSHQANSGSSKITDMRMNLAEKMLLPAIGTGSSADPRRTYSETVLQASFVQKSCTIVLPSGVTNTLTAFERALTVHSSSTLENKAWNFSGKHSAAAVAEQSFQGFSNSHYQLGNNDPNFSRDSVGLRFDEDEKEFLTN